MLNERIFYSEDDTQARIAYEHDGRIGVAIFKQTSAEDRRKAIMTRTDDRPFDTFQEALGFAMAITL